MRAADLLAKWRQSPDLPSMVALCDELATAAEQSPGSLTADIAIQVGAEAEKHYPKDFEILLATGRLYLASGELHRALKPLIEAARIASEPRALRFLGEVFLRLGDARHAAMSFERAIKRGATDTETHAWHQSARGYMPLQEQHGAKHVAGLVEKASAHVAADESEDDEGSLPRFRTPFPSDAELLDLSDSDDEKTDVLTMSRVVAAIQQSPPGARGDFAGMIEAARKRFDTSADGAPTLLRKDGDSDSGPIDFDLDREGSGHEIFDADGPTPGMDEPTHELRPHRSEPPSTALNAATNRLANAASARPGVRVASSAPPAVATVPLPATPPPAGPISATSDRIIPLDLSGAGDPPVRPPAQAQPKPTEKASAAKKPEAKATKSKSLAPPARKKRGGVGVGIVAAFTAVTILGGGVLAVRLGVMPGLAAKLPPWVSGKSPAVPTPEPPADLPSTDEPVEENAPPEEPTAEPTALEDVPPEPTASASADATASAAASAKAPPAAPPPTPPPTSKPTAKKPPPPSKPPPDEPPPSGEPPDVVWLGDPELQ